MIFGAVCRFGEMVPKERSTLLPLTSFGGARPCGEADQRPIPRCTPRMGRYDAVQVVVRFMMIGSLSVRTLSVLLFKRCSNECVV